MKLYGMLGEMARGTRWQSASRLDSSRGAGAFRCSPCPADFFELGYALAIRSLSPAALWVDRVQQRISTGCGDEHGFAAVLFQQDVRGAPDIKVSDMAVLYTRFELSTAKIGEALYSKSQAVRRSIKINISLTTFSQRRDESRGGKISGSRQGVS